MILVQAETESDSLSAHMRLFLNIVGGQVGGPSTTLISRWSSHVRVVVVGG